MSVKTFAPLDTEIIHRKGKVVFCETLPKHSLEIKQKKLKRAYKCDKFGFLSTGSKVGNKIAGSFSPLARHKITICAIKIMPAFNKPPLHTHTDEKNGSVILYILILCMFNQRMSH